MESIKHNTSVHILYNIYAGIIYMYIYQYDTIHARTSRAPANARKRYTTGYHRLYADSPRGFAVFLLRVLRCTRHSLSVIARGMRFPCYVLRRRTRRSGPYRITMSPVTVMILSFVRSNNGVQHNKLQGRSPLNFPERK